jgi:hypothetical protein
MSTPTSERSHFRTSLWQRFKGLLIGAVPEDIAICEFDCRKNQCTYGEWASCQHRIQLTALCHQRSVDARKDATGSITPKSGSDLVQS